MGGGGWQDEDTSLIPFFLPLLKTSSQGAAPWMLETECDEQRTRFATTAHM